MKKTILVLFALSLVLLSLAPVSSQASAIVDPRVLQDTTNGAVGNFIVVLKSQAPTRAIAASTNDPMARGRAVYSALKQIADATQPAVRAQLDSLGVKYRAFYVVNALAVEGNRAVVDALAARADVQSIEPDRAFRVSLEQPESGALSSPTTIEWNINKITAPSLWNLGYRGQGIVYANADTGVQWDHPALKSHYRGWNGTTVDHNFNWWDAIQSPIVGGSICGYATLAPCDDYGHGTHTMGTGIGDDGAGNQIGVAPGAKWMACRNMDDGTGRPSTYISCYQFFLAPTDLSGNNANPDLRPDAVGNSYTCPLGPPPSGEECSITSLQNAITNLRAAGIFMSVSAGNSGSGCSTINEPPSVYDLSITVGATDSNDNIVGFSSRGPVTIDGITLMKPNLVAPGWFVRSSIPTNGYGYESGTSMSAPHVAGAVALLWSAFPQLRRNVNETEYLLEQSAAHFTTTQGCGGDSSTQMPNNVYGYGRVDVMAAYNLALSTGFPPNRFYYFPLLLNGTTP